MEGGAWQSDVFDNGRDFQKERASPAQATAGTTPPAMYNPAPMSIGKDSGMFGIVAVVLRGTLFLFTLIALSVMGSNKSTFYYSYYGTYSTTVEFTAVKAFVYARASHSSVCLCAVRIFEPLFLNC